MRRYVMPQGTSLCACGGETKERWTWCLAIASERKRKCEAAAFRQTSGGPCGGLRMRRCSPDSRNGNLPTVDQRRSPIATIANTTGMLRPSTDTLLGVIISRRSAPCNSSCQARAHRLAKWSQGQRSRCLFACVVARRALERRQEKRLDGQSANAASNATSQKAALQ